MQRHHNWNEPDQTTYFHHVYVLVHFYFYLQRSDLFLDTGGVDAGEMIKFVQYINQSTALKDIRLSCPDNRPLVLLK